MNNTNPKVEAFIERAKQWRAETEKLREIAHECGLTEELKWGKPCYAYNDSNIVLVQGFKEFVALLFFKGVLLKDPSGILVRVGENSRSAMQVRFTEVSQIVEQEALLKAYIAEAIEIEKAGLKVQTEKNPEPIPEELLAKFEAAPALQEAFEKLTPGRQRAYILHFSGAKQSATRTSRIEKCTPQILAGKGLNE